MITQLSAILLDSLRLLLSRKLFWLSLGMSVLASVVLFGSYTFNPDGVKILWFDTLKNPMLRADSQGPRMFVVGVFSSIYVQLWLSWAAVILALVSTASILPDFLAGGSIELTLSRPIGRFSLFLFKVLGALLFVLLQTAAGVGAAVLLMGALHGVWIPSALWAIPLITLQFFYLFSFSALLAVLTRSTLACVLGTAVFWFVIFLIQFASNRLDEVATRSEARIARVDRQIARITEQSSENNREPTPGERLSIQGAELRKKGAAETLAAIASWRTGLRIATYAVPKTGDVQKILANTIDAPKVAEIVTLFGDPPDRSGQSDEDISERRETQLRVETELRNVNAASSLITSAVVSFVIFGAAVVIFSRRDF